MPRKLRLEFPGAMYHIMSRGDQREDIFLCAPGKIKGCKNQSLQTAQPSSPQQLRVSTWALMNYAPKHPFLRSDPGLTPPMRGIPNVLSDELHQGQIARY